MNEGCRYAVSALFVLLVLGAVPPAFADDSEGLGSSVGFGMDIGVHRTRYLGPSHPAGLAGNRISYFGPAGLSNSIRLPIEVGDGWILEPKISGRYGRARETFVAPEGAEETGDGPPASQRVESTHLSLDATLQLHHTWRVGESTRGFAGGQIGAGYTESTRSSVDSSGQTGADSNPDLRGRHLVFGPVIGAEHFLFDALSIGLEAELLGRVSRRDNRPNYGPSNEFTVSPGGALVVRTYF